MQPLTLIRRVRDQYHQLVLTGLRAPHRDGARLGLQELERSRPTLGVVVVWLLGVGATFIQVYTTFLSLQTPLLPVLLDWAVASACVLAGMMLWALWVPVRLTRLMYIHQTRRRLGRGIALQNKPGCRRRIAPWRIGLSVGLLIYAALAAGAVGGAWVPPWLIHAGTTAGHARLAPIVVLPICVEVFRLAKPRAARKRARDRRDIMIDQPQL